MHIMRNISNKFWVNSEGWKLVQGPFIILLKWQYNKIRQVLVADLFHF